MLFYLLTVGTKWGMAGVVAAIVAAASGVFALIAWALYQVRLHWPMKSVTYLIPKSKYKAAEFPGAPNTEQCPDTITLGVGVYRLQFRIVPRLEITVNDEPMLDFVGPGSDSIEVTTIDNRFYKLTMTPQGGIFLRDWHGSIHSQIGYPLVHMADEPWVLGFKVRTHEMFSGKARLYLRIRGRKMLIRQLPFTVDPEASDDLHFLREPLESHEWTGSLHEGQADTPVSQVPSPAKR